MRQSAEDGQNIMEAHLFSMKFSKYLAYLVVPLLNILLLQALSLVHFLQERDFQPPIQWTYEFALTVISL